MFVKRLRAILIDWALYKYCIIIIIICKKAARQLAVLKRLGHLLTRQGKLAIFKSFITSNFNYCPLIWHFCSQSSTKKLEKIQERALRFIYNDYSSTHHDLLKTANTEHLHVKRITEMACEVFKIFEHVFSSAVHIFEYIVCRVMCTGSKFLEIYIYGIYRTKGWSFVFSV